MEPVHNKFVIAVSFINYLKERNGMAKALLAQQQMYQANDTSYVYLFAVKKLIFKEKITAFCMFGLVIDGNFAGIYQLNQLIYLFQKWLTEGHQLKDLHIHHFMYIPLQYFDRLLEKFEFIPVKIYLHDYFMICSNYILMKNDEIYCGSEGISNSHCHDCFYYKKGRKTLIKIETFLSRNYNRITVIAPSQAAKTIFLGYYKEFTEKVMVIPHQCSKGFYKGNLKQITNTEKIKIAFLGIPSKHKGWEQWNKIMETFPKENYELYVFNNSAQEYENAVKVNIQYMPSNMNAMTEALRNNKIHAVLLWALWPETYSYTCFESYSANVFIITNPESGNIADFVRRTKNGIVLNNEEELMDLIKNPLYLIYLVNQYRNAKIFGPMELYENTTILQLTEKIGVEKMKIKKCHNPIAVNVVLLKVLEELYKRESI